MGTNLDLALDTLTGAGGGGKQRNNVSSLLTPALTCLSGVRQWNGAALRGGCHEKELNMGATFRAWAACGMVSVFAPLAVCPSQAADIVTLKNGMILEGDLAISSLKSDRRRPSARG